MIKFELNEIAFIYKVISEKDIKGADAPFVSIVLNKLTDEADILKNKKEKEKQ